MSTEQDNAPNDAAASTGPATSESSSPSPQTSEAATPQVPAHAAGSSASPAEGDHHEGADGADDADGAEGPEGTDGTEGAGDGVAAVGEVGPDGQPRKKRRRRRKKKKPEGAQAEGATAEGAEGASAGEGAAAQAPGGQQPRRKKEKKPQQDRPERERPPFGVGDIVFGKVLEVTEDVLFIDVSGKGRGIFDLRELLIPEEEARAARAQAKADAEADEAERRARKAAEAPSAAEATDGAEVASDEASTAPAEASEPAEGVDPMAQTREVDVPEIASSMRDAAAALADAADATAATTSDAETTTDEAAAPAEEPATPMLPRVVLEPGAQFVGVVHNDGGRGGCIVLTHHPERFSRSKRIVAQAHKDNALVYGIITGVIKGGVEVDVDGLRAFAPASHMDLRLGSDLSHLVGKRLPFAVTQYGKRGRDVVLSRRAMLEAEAKEARENALKNIEVGATVEGTVRTVVTFGAFIDIGGIEGLVPLSEMSHNRSDGPSDVFKVGDKVRVQILRVDDRGKLWLSRKATLDDPWGPIAEKYAVGSRHTGKVVRLHPAGAFVELEAGVDGLIRKGDLSIKRIDQVSDVVKEGDSIEVIVAQLDTRGKRIALHRVPEGAAADEAPQKVVLHKTVKVVVVSIEPGGLVVRVLGTSGWQARGFITAGGTGTPRGTELRKHFPVGKQLEAKIIEVDPKRGEVKLSIKALHEDTERNAYQAYRAQAKREAKFGTFADLLAKRNETKS